MLNYTFQTVDGGFIVNINKPENWTSFDVVHKVRNITNIKKVGHAGTLGPVATGLLIIGVGSGTKLLNNYTNMDKEYIVTLKFGITTDTQDITGKIIKEKKEYNVTKSQFTEICKSFQGKIKMALIPLQARVSVFPIKFKKKIKQNN